MTYDEVRAAFDYDPHTGEFTWLVSPAYNVKAGSPAGGVHKLTGYVNIKYKDRLYTAGRLAWLYMTGEWPRFTIDHWNGIKTDNRFSNLRDATAEEQAHNRRKPRGRNSQGLMGVTWAKKMSKWKATLCVDGRNKHLGYFESREVAFSAYLKEREKHYFPNFSLE